MMPTETSGQGVPLASYGDDVNVEIDSCLEIIMEKMRRQWFLGWGCL
jgi:hypothetical protein